MVVILEWKLQGDQVSKAWDLWHHHAQPLGSAPEEKQWHIWLFQTESQETLPEKYIWCIEWFVQTGDCLNICSSLPGSNGINKADIDQYL